MLMSLAEARKENQRTMNVPGCLALFFPPRGTVARPALEVLTHLGGPSAIWNRGSSSRRAT